MPVKKRNPMLTKSGKPRLGPLSLAQLHDIAGKSTKPKNSDKIQRRISNLEKKLGCKYTRNQETTEE